MSERSGVADLQLSDDEVGASTAGGCYVRLGSFTAEQWELILKHDVRGEVLELARGGSWEPVQRLLDSLEALEGGCHEQTTVQN